MVSERPRRGRFRCVALHFCHALLSAAVRPFAGPHVPRSCLLAFAVRDVAGSRATFAVPKGSTRRPGNERPGQWKAGREPRGRMTGDQ